MLNPSLALMFKALGEPTRLAIFQTLRACRDGCSPGPQGSAVVVDEAGNCRPSGSLSVGEVCCRLDGGVSTISHHLKELRLAGLIRMEKQGRWIYCSVEPEALEQLRLFLSDEGEAECPACVVAANETPGPEPAANR